MKDKITERMKSFYEEPARTKLTRRTPVIVRVDGRAFHTFTKNLKKPFDEFMTRSMQATALYLLKNIQGAKFVYTQSDEISLLLIDYENLDSSAFFDYEVQKLASIIASMATLKFNQTFTRAVEDYNIDIMGNDEKRKNLTAEEKKYLRAIQDCAFNGATFDARCFNIPEHEMVNYFIGRQKDAYRNSIASIGHALFSQKMLNKKHTEDIIQMISEYKGIRDLTSEYPMSLLYGMNWYRTTDENGKSAYQAYDTKNFNEIREQMEKDLLPVV